MMILGGAFLLGLALALAPRTPTAHAQEPAAPAAAAKPAAKSPTITDGRSAEIGTDIREKDRTEPPTEAAPGVSSGAKSSPDGNAGDSATRHDARPRNHPRVTIDRLGTDPDFEFDSFEEFVNNEPALFAMVVGIVAVIFFAPVLAIALILWYRMRKARLLNETMLKLAEKGVVPSADALDALAGGKQAAVVAPYYEQARQVQRRAAWSDLRKGVLMSAFGLALSVYSLLEDREPNGLGLVLLFVGLGFIVLWWFEERRFAAPHRASPAPTPDPGSGVPPGNPPPA